MKSKTSITLSVECKQWLESQNLNLSKLVDDQVRVMMDAEGRLSADEKEIESEIEYHRERIKEHRQQLLAKSAELNRLRSEREVKRKEELEELRMYGDALARSRTFDNYH